MLFYHATDNVNQQRPKMMVFTIDPDTGKPVLKEIANSEADEDNDEGDGGDNMLLDNGDETPLAMIANGDEKLGKGDMAENADTNAQFKTPKKKKHEKQVKSEDNELKEEKPLHSGEMLGELPQLPNSGGSHTRTVGSPKKDFGSSLEAAIEGNTTNSLTYIMDQNQSSPGASAGKKKGGKKKKRQIERPKDVPTNFLCELSQQQMSDPVRTIYGNVYDRPIIRDWLKNQGHICPITGMTINVWCVLSDADSSCFCSGNVM